jgi:2-dehydro-3-deoxygalactonokinase
LDWHGPFIAVDWGTTNRRAWRIGVDGTVEDSLSDGAGITAVRAGGFAAEAATLRDRLGDLPMLLGGMIGSDRGWRNVPYVSCPADACSLVQGIVWIDPRTGIVPGVSQRDPQAPEVMRGEEVQIIGSLAHRTIPSDAVVCCPGTHSKWVRIEAGRIVRFATWMTGELFALLSRHSILAPLMTGKTEAGADFAAGVTASAEGDALGQLFALRAAALLDLPPPEIASNAASYASGLLIGTEMRAALARFDGQAPWFIGRADLCALYAAANAQMLGGGDQRQRVIDGEAAFRAGITAIIGELR